MRTRAYKGFNMDMTCRGFKFEENMTYLENNAQSDQKGFHACMNPLDCFRYYKPSKSVYRLVYIDDLDDKISHYDSKICGNAISIGKELNCNDLIQEHFEYVKNYKGNIYVNIVKPISSDNGSLIFGEVGSIISSGNTSAISGRSHSNIAVGCCSSIIGDEKNIISSGDLSSVLCGEHSHVSSGYRSAVSAEERSTVSCGCESIVSSGYNSTVSCQSNSKISSGYHSEIAARSNVEISAGNSSIISAGNHSVIICESDTIISAGDYSEITCGENCVVSAYNSKVRAGLNTLISLANRERTPQGLIITEYASAIIDDQKLKSNTWYTLIDGKFVETTA